MRDITKEKFGKLTPLKLVPSTNTRRRWLCKCDCGNEKSIQENHLLHYTKSCGCLQQRKGKDSPHFKGHGDISLDFFGTIRRGALDRNIKFDITIEHIWDLYLSQDKK